GASRTGRDRPPTTPKAPGGPASAARPRRQTRRRAIIASYDADMRRLLLLAVIVAAPICGAARATDDTPCPVLYVSPNNQGLGIPVTLSFRAFHLAELARTMRITITIPAAYSVNPAYVAGRAEVRRAMRVGGRATLYTGGIVASRRAW